MLRLEKDWIVPTRWSWITEPQLVGQAPSWVCMMFAEAIGAPLFNGNGWANNILIQSDPLHATSDMTIPSHTFDNAQGLWVFQFLESEHIYFNNKLKIYM